MEANQVKSKKKQYKKPEPEKTFSHGPITAEVYTKSTSTGFRYQDFRLTRTWQQADGKKNASLDYFAENQEDLIDAIREATVYIRGERQSAQTCADTAAAAANTQHCT